MIVHLVCRLFYESHLAVSVSSILSLVSDSRTYRDTEHCMVFTNTLYRVNRSSFLVKIFIINIISNLVISVSCLGVSVHSFSELMLEESLVWLIWCLTLTIISAHACLQLLGLSWTLVTRSRSFSQLMRLYSSYLDKVDVARGRSVPVPVDNHKSPVQILPSLNPYNTSPDLKLILDLIAAKSGSGLALRILATLEHDFNQSWAPTGLQAEWEDDNLVIYWKDAIVVKYLASNPGLNIHYGLELEEAGRCSRAKIISHQEVRFLKQTWRANNPSNIDLGHVVDDFIYHERLQCSPVLHLVVRVWTVVNGELISYVESNIFSRDHHYSHQHSPDVHHTHATRASLESIDEEENHQVSENTHKKHFNYKDMFHQKDVKKLRTSSETNLNNNNISQFSRTNNQRKTLPLGHVNLAFIDEDENADPHLLI